MSNVIPVAPGIGATFYGRLARDLDTPLGHEVIAACDLVCLHTSVDASDVDAATLVRSLGCQRVWLGVPANYLSRLDIDHGRAAALAEVRRIATIARDMAAEVLELNGEGASDGQKIGDWTSAPRDATEDARLESLGVELVEAIRAVYTGAIGWTSHDGVRSFRIPRAHLALVDLHSPQHYPAMPGRLADQRTLERRVAWSRGQWEALAEHRGCPVDVVPGGVKWSPYYQGHGHTTAALVWGLCEAATARLWACPSSWSPEAVQALTLARRLRAAVGHGPEAVERWQTAHGLASDGVIGPATLGSLASASDT